MSAVQHTPNNNTVESLYPLWLKENRQKALASHRESERMLVNLRNVGSTYWLTAKAMCDARQRVLQVWLDMPETLPGAETATDAAASVIKASLASSGSSRKGEA